MHTRDTKEYVHAKVSSLSQNCLTAVESLNKIDDLPTQNNCQIIRHSLWNSLKCGLMFEDIPMHSDTQSFQLASLDGIWLVRAAGSTYPIRSWICSFFSLLACSALIPAAAAAAAAASARSASLFRRSFSLRIVIHSLTSSIFISMRVGERRSMTSRDSPVRRKCLALTSAVEEKPRWNTSR